MATSAALLTFYGLAWLKLRQAARQWRRARLRDCSVWIAERVGPAVFGFFKPQVVLPRWLHDGPATTRSLVLAHEQEHIAARDQLLLLLALLLMLLTPWNLPLWWQLRRLRFAIEVDCDARVLSRGADSAAYAETLLAVGQHRSQMPLGAIALTEPVSQLERRIRIMMTRPRHSHVLLMGACLALSTSLVGTAAVLTAPEAVSTTAPRKLPPSSDREIGPRLEELLKEQFPELLRENTSGTAIVTVLFNSAGTVERTEKETLSGPPASFAPSEEHFRRVGLSPQEVAYVGVQAIKSPANNAEILVAFTERKRPNEYFVSKLFPDTRELDRAIVERYFPDALHGGVPAEARLWVLLDRSGQVLRTGREPFEASSLSDMLEERFVGIKTSEITVTPVTDQTSRPVSVRGGSGEMLQLHCVWLAVGSPPPDAAS
jgi:hypothetical protein